MVFTNRVLLSLLLLYLHMKILAGFQYEGKIKLNSLVFIKSNFVSSKNNLKQRKTHKHSRLIINSH